MKTTVYIAMLLLPAFAVYIGSWQDPNGKNFEYLWPFIAHPALKLIYNDFCWKYKAYWAVSVALLVSICNLRSIILENSKKKIIKSFLQAFIQEQVKGPKSEHRVTIFKVRSGLSPTIQHVRRCVLGNTIAHFKKGCLWHYCSSIPIPFRKYLMQFSRYGVPLEAGSSTKFKVIEDEMEGFDSVASECFYKQEVIIKKLPKIDLKKIISFKTLEDLETANSDLRTSVEKYMVQCNVHSFQHLKTFHRLPNYIYATLLTGKNSNPWGVLVYDSYCDEKTLDNLMQPSNKKKLTMFAREIGNIIKN